MALISKPNTFTVGATIVASEHNSNYDVIYQDYNGNITDANISASAAISGSKLAQITTASKVSGAALTSLSSIPVGAGSIPAANITDFAISGGTNGAVLYNNGTSWVALASGTTGNFLKTTLGSAPAWASATPFSILDYGSSFSASTQRGVAGSTLKMAYGSTGTGVAGSSSQNVTNLPFTSGTSYVVLIGNYTAFNMTATSKAAGQFTLTNTHGDAVGGNGNGDWLAIGI